MTDHAIAPPPDDVSRASSAPQHHRIVAGVRPGLLIVVGAVVATVGARGEPATSPLLEYRIRALAVLFVGVGAAGFLVGVRRGAAWGFELVPAAAGTIAAMALVSSLADTPFAQGGLSGDQTFRTAAVTRFADSWQNADFTIRGLPSFYPPAYFWVLGRLAAILNVEPWRMLKVGAIATTLVVPMVAFVLWRRVVPARVAALVSVVTIVVGNTYEPYSWLVIVTFVPWWLEVVHGVHRPGRPPGSPLLLGLVGALMIVTYWYFFAIGVVAIAIKLLVDRFGAGIDRSQIRRAARVFGIAGAACVVYWLPLVLSVARVGRAESLGARWFNASHPELPLPMLDLTATGLIALAGLVYLAWAWSRDPVARGLGVLLAAAYVWYLIGAAAAAADHPLLSFRGKVLIPLILLIAGVIALARLFNLGNNRWRVHDLVRVSVAIGVVLGAYVAQGMIDDVRDSPRTEAARAAALPDQSPPEPSAAALQQMIESSVGRRAVLVSDRVDVLAFYPNHAFVVWDAHYAHPASEFERRIEFLTELTRLDDPVTFRALVERNPYDSIDAFVLLDEGDHLVFRYGADAFPAGTRTTLIRFPEYLFSEFDRKQVGDHVLATPR